MIVITQLFLPAFYEDEGCWMGSVPNISCSPVKIQNVMMQLSEVGVRSKDNERPNENREGPQNNRIVRFTLEKIFVDLA